MYAGICHCVSTVARVRRLLRTQREAVGKLRASTIARRNCPQC